MSRRAAGGRRSASFPFEQPLEPPRSASLNAAAQPWAPPGSCPHHRPKTGIAEGPFLGSTGPDGRRLAGGLLYCATVPILAVDYRWWVFIHLAGVFMFLLAHGASVSALFRLRKERDREKIRQLIQFSGS